MLGWWKGHRAAEPVQPMEKWKCRSCVFLRDCNASPLDAEERAAALAAQEEAAEAEKRALEEFEESTNAGASGAALQAERQQQAEHEQVPLQPQRDSQRQSEQLLEKQEEMRQKDRDMWSSLSSPATPARQTLLQQSQGTGDMEQLSHQGPSFLSRFVRVQSSEPCTQALKQVTTEQHPGARGLQPQQAEEQGSHSVQRCRQQQHQGHPQQEQRSQNQRLHTVVFPVAARTTATQLAGRSAAPVPFSPAGTAHHTSLLCSRDAYSSPRKNISAIGADGLSFSSAARQGARESDTHTARAAAAGARDADAYRPAARAMQAIAAAATTSGAGHNPRGVPCETVPHFNARAACATQFVAPTTPECSVNRDARRTCGVVDVPSSASFLGNRANAQGKCARGYRHNSHSTAARGNSAHLLSGSFAAVAGADTTGKFGETQNLLAAQRKPPAVAALQRLSPEETAPPAASASPSPQGAACVADSRCAILTSQTPADNSVPSAAATTLFPAAALASRETVFPEGHGQPAGSSGSKGDSLGDAARPLAGTGNNEKAARAAATGTTIGPAEAASEATNTRMKQLPTAAIGKHERHGSVCPSGTFSQVPVRPNFTTTCRSTNNMNGRSSSQTNLNSSRASFVTPAKRSRSLATGSAAGGAATAVGGKQPATLKSREGHAEIIKRQLSSSDQRQKDSREQRQLPRRTSSFPIAVSKHQTQIIRYFTAERPAS